MENSLNMNLTYRNVYLKKQPTIPGRQCGIVFSAYYSYQKRQYSLMKFKDCEPYANAQYFFLSPELVSRVEISQSLQKTHIVLILFCSSKYSIFQVRSIKDPHIIHFQYKRFFANYTFKWATYSFKEEGDIFLLHQGSFIVKKDIQKIIKSQTVGLKSIKNIEVQQKCSALYGLILGSSLQNQVFIKKTIGVEIRINIESEIRNAGLDVLCNRLAIISGDYLTIYSIETSAPSMIYNQSFPQAQNVKFIRSNELLLTYFNGSVQIITTLNPEIANRSKVSNQLVTKSIINNDHNLYAVLADQKTVRIFTTQQELVRQFSFSNSTSPITGISFSQTNFVYAALNNGSIYELQPTPCPQTFINTNGFCLCEQNHTLMNNKCQCTKNFIPQAGKCVCNTDEFEYDKGLCQCDSYAVQNKDKCVCLENFIKNGSSCLCPPSFELKQSERQCLCTYGYVQNNQCIGCLFFCGKCSGPFSCKTYSLYFYGMIIGGFLLVVLIGVIIVCCVKKRKLKLKNRAYLIAMTVQSYDQINIQDYNNIKLTFFLSFKAYAYLFIIMKKYERKTQKIIGLHSLIAGILKDIFAISSINNI